MVLADKFRNLPIRFKLLFLFFSVFTLTIILASLATYSLVRITIEKNIESELANTTTSIVNMVGDTATASIRNYLRAIAEKNLEIVRHIYSEFLAGNLSEEEARRLASGILLSQKIGETGYIYILNSHGVLEVHPKELLRGADLSQYGFIQEQIKRKEGYLEYEWKNPGELKKRPKALYMAYFAPWDWIISASSYREEFKSLINVKDFRSSILSVRFGETGYVYVIDGQGNLIIHPKLEEGQNVLNYEDAAGRKFIREMCEKKRGRIIYPWQNPDEPAAREKLVLFDYIPELDWIVASSSYLEEFYAPLKTLRYTIVMTLVAALFLAAILTLWVSGTITLPLRRLMERFSTATEGDLSVRLEDYGRDEVGQLATYFNNLMEKLEAEITERRRVGNELRKSEQTMADIIGFFPDATLVIDREGKVIAWNQAMEQMTGVKQKEILGQGDYAYAIPFYGDRRPILIDLVTIPDEERVAKYHKVLRRDNMLIGEGYVNRLPSGRRYLFATAVPLYDPQGNLMGAIESVRDITDRKQTEEELQRYQENLEERVQIRTAELQEVTEEAQEARRAAEAANRAKSTFLANMSHELRTPLNAVLGFSELMMRDPQLSPGQRENLETINRSGDHLLALINDVLEMSKIEAGRTTLALHSFNLYRLIDSIEDMFGILARKKGLKIVVERAAGVPEYIHGDESKLRQILINLLGNSIKFTDEGYITLRVGCAAEDQAEQDFTRFRLSFEVEDTGPGIPEEDLLTLFEAFCQTELGQMVQGGTGLGLTISHQFVALMGGELRVTSPVWHGSGACFSFEIIVAPADQAEIATLQTVPHKHIVGLEPGSSHYRILLVDDKRSNRELLLKLLRPLGFELQEAVNGKDGIEIWRTFRPHLVWMDLRMPIMDGYEATSRIRRVEKEEAETAGPSKRQRTVIIAISASALEIQRAEDLPEDFDDYLKKPFREAEMFKMMQEHLDLHFRYEEPRSEELKEILDVPVHLGRLPKELLADLQEAVEMSDMDQIELILDQVGAHDPALAEILRIEANNFDFDMILEAIALVKNYF